MAGLGVEQGPVSSPRRITRVSLVAATLVLACTGVALGKASHDGWPTIDGELKMHTYDGNGHMFGTDRSDELLGGHGHDTIRGRGSADVIWGDYKPCCQPARQRDVLDGGAGNDHIYAATAGTVSSPGRAAT